MLQHLLDLAVLALAQPHGDPDVGALLALQRGLDAGIVDAVDTDPGAERRQHVLRHLAMRAHAVAAQPGGGGKLQHPRQAAVVGEQDQPFGINVEPPDRDEARQILGQIVEDGWAPLGIARRRH